MSPGTDRNAVAEARIADPAALSRCVTRGMSAMAWSRIGDGRIGTELSEPRQHFIQRRGHPDDGPAMQGDQGLVVALIRILDDRDRVLPDRITDAIHAG